MGIIDRIRQRSAPRDDGDRGAEQASSGDGHQLPIARYDRLDAKEVVAQLPTLSQVELTAVEDYERGHRNRPVVLDKLRYMCTTEPLPGYDTLNDEQIIEAVAGADRQTLRAVRDYERKFQRRRSVSDAIAEMLPSAQLSVSETRSQEEKDERVRSKAGGSQP